MTRALFLHKKELRKPRGKCRGLEPNTTRGNVFRFDYLYTSQLVYDILRDDAGISRQPPGFSRIDSNVQSPRSLTICDAMKLCMG